MGPTGAEKYDSRYAGACEGQRDGQRCNAPGAYVRVWLTLQGLKNAVSPALCDPCWLTYSGYTGATSPQGDREGA